jgi:16S rRNA (adenine1518-N6/adenine1519-N6)-dimethyltransferase
MTLSDIKFYLAERGLRPLKQFGQNFLHDQNICRWLVEQIGPVEPGVSLLEIGPGLGAITEVILKAGIPLVAIEKDRGLAAFLREHFDNEAHFQLHEGDALEVLPVLGQEQPFPTVCGNLPYNVSTPLIMTLLDWPQPPRRMVFTLQRELAQRLASGPGSKDYSALSILIQAEYEVSLLKKLPHSVFYPEPEIESAVVLLTARPKPLVAPEHRAAFRELVKKGFSQRRKKLSNLIGGNDSRRAEELTVEEWCRLGSPI